jgi:hypothetical protein
MPRRSGPKPFTCCQCEKSYSTRFSLRRHINDIHSGSNASKSKSSHNNDRIIPRVEVNSRYYEKNKERLRHDRISRQQYSIAHIDLLKERICNIVDGAYDNQFPDKPIEPSAEDLNCPFTDSKSLWERYKNQLAAYDNKMYNLKQKLQEIPWDDISARVARRLIGMNISEDEFNVQTDASDADSSDIESNDE